MTAGFFNPIQTKQMMTTKSITPYFIAILCIHLAACNTKTNNAYAKTINKNSDTVAVYTFPVQEGYGYSIFVDNKEFIRQDCIPAIQGNKPFVSKEEAKNAGVLVAQKIQHNELPTLSLQELKQLGITR